ncbi:MAG TPA: iron uptake transporter permease EfeU [Conexibacter sp.]|nr:iron uptake transporter permease EfeU [Conexibacter sp.]
MTQVFAALPTVQFVIGLREGVEAALIVGIIGSFLAQQGRRDALRWMWAGVALAVALCVGVAAILTAIDESLPQRQQEGFEAIVGLVAVTMVTFMIVYMRRNARKLSSELRDNAAAALAAGSAVGLVAMAFLAVMREGLETAMFLLATFESSAGVVNPVAAGFAAFLGLLCAAVIGLLIYRGGMKLNLARFFRITAVLLVLIAAGLVSSALHHANEAAMFTTGNTQALDLSAVIVPASDSIVSGLITGLLGVYPFPTVAEVVGWLLYAVPMLTFVLWPQRRPSTSRRVAAPASVG